MNDLADVHAPGSRTLTASRWPCLVVPPSQRPDWAPSPYSLAAHMQGTVPLPDPGRIVRRGHVLEGGALKMAEEDGGFIVERTQPWFEHASLSAGATPDAVGTKEGNPATLEVKVVNPWMFEREWQERPPVWYRAQVQCQLACSGHEFGYIGAMVVEHGGVDFHLFAEPRYPELIGLLEARAAEFLETIERGEMPEPDESRASYRVLTSLVDVKPKLEIHIGGPDAAARLRVWRGAADDLKHAQATVDACKHWFAKRVGDACEVTVDGGGRLKRSVVKASTYTVDRDRSWQWRLSK